MAKQTLKILRYSHRKIFKVCLAIFEHYEIKGQFRKKIKSIITAFINFNFLLLHSNKPALFNFIFYFLTYIWFPSAVGFFPAYSVSC